MSELSRHVRNMVGRSHEEQIPKQTDLFPCAIYAVDCRFKRMWLQNMDTGDLIQFPVSIPHQDIYRIPTSDRNFVVLLTMGQQHLGGVPFLMDRNFLEPNLFETVDPAGEQA